MKKLGPTQHLVLTNVAARRAPYEGHKSHAEYTRRMEVARQLEKRGLLATLPFGSPQITGLASMYRLTPDGAEALRQHEPEPATYVRRRTSRAHSTIKKSPAQLKREIDAALARRPSTHTKTDAAGTFYLTEASPTSAPLEEPEFRSRLAAKRAAMKLVRDGAYPGVEVWHRWRGDRYMQGIADADGWSDV